MGLKEKVNRIAQALGGREPVVVIFTHPGAPEPPPEWLAVQVERALQEDPRASYIFLEWPPELPRPQEWGEEE
jgi:hypothetical protein